MSDRIPFNRPYATGNELAYLTEAQRQGHLSGDGSFTHRCHQWIEQRTGCVKALLTQSCTSALDLAALLLKLEPGDEVIMPSFTFVSTANAFVLRGAVPVFVDIREDTLNLDEKLIEAAITPRTRAIVPVHYAGVSCEMDMMAATAARHNLAIVEDADGPLVAPGRAGVAALRTQPAGRAELALIDVRAIGRRGAARGAAGRSSALAGR